MLETGVGTALLQGPLAYLWGEPGSHVYRVACSCHGRRVCRHGQDCEGLGLPGSSPRGLVLWQQELLQLPSDLP